MALPDFNIVCLFNNEKDLLFFSSYKFKLCLIITHWPESNVCLAYSQKKSGSMLAIGDKRGTVNILTFPPVSKKKNPFMNMTVLSFSYADMMFSKMNKTNLSFINLDQFPGQYSTNMRQLQFCDSGKFLVSVSTISINSMVYCWVGSHSEKQDQPIPDNHHVSMVNGFLCVCWINKSLMATGSVNDSVRLWDFDKCSADGIPQNIHLRGHDTAVQHVFYNRVNCYLYSVGIDCVVKMWDVVNSFACLLTFHEVAIMIKTTGLQYFPAYFNQFEQEIVMVIDTWFETIKCTDNVMNIGVNFPMHSDMDTDNNSDLYNEVVIKTIYCRLFRILISVSPKDSGIAVWNLYTGHLINKWTMAHAKQVYGKTLPVEITAANLDPSGGLLVTGAINGSVHMWDPNTSTCLNRLKIPSRDRISHIIWLPNKVCTSVIRVGMLLIRCNSRFPRGPMIAENDFFFFLYLFYIIL